MLSRDFYCILTAEQFDFGWDCFLVLCLFVWLRLTFCLLFENIKEKKISKSNWRRRKLFSFRFMSKFRHVWHECRICAHSHRTLRKFTIIFLCFFFGLLLKISNVQRAKENVEITKIVTPNCRSGDLILLCRSRFHQLSAKKTKNSSSNITAQRRREAKQRFYFFSYLCMILGSCCCWYNCAWSRKTRMAERMYENKCGPTSCLFWSYFLHFYLIFQIIFKIE